MKRICLITHCEATHTVDGRVGGWFNSDLTEKGKQQASQLPGKIRELGFDFQNLTVYSSDLKRATQTAQILTSGTNTPPILDQRLREMSFGTHGGMIQSEHNKIMIPVSPNGNRLDHQICKGAESRRNVAERICQFVDEIMQLEKDKIVVTHGFAATFFIAAFQKIEISSMGYINYMLNPGSISILEEDSIFRNRVVKLLNG
ncbi:histidine phosphatase family protein [Aquimarina sp. 2201CG5-10]|uniref:histidine phosphatase family protein n=1 Tax=Aquimarina callyspongiae TaxID=3098150 RepID=UPI002AB46030|nr:histidine phosphatase family protein [Aquimarina sp. 2201CG5-10]MDY8137504.1 histidine phosphatase family protein [Aquimarina sp. 2201CG5-10]